MMGIIVPETCCASNKICNNNHLLRLGGILFPRNNDDAGQNHFKCIFLLNQEIKVHKTSALESTLRKPRDGFANASNVTIL
jgi:hypothetical protein